MKAVILAASLLSMFLGLSGCGGSGGSGGGGAKPAGVNVPEVVIAPGVSMPMLASGTFSWSFAGDCTVASSVEQWLRLGGRHIALSLAYKTEPNASKGIKASGVPRKDLFLNAMVEGPIGYDKTVDQVMKGDLVELGVDYIDLLLMHWPCPGDDVWAVTFPNMSCGSVGKEQRLDTWRGMEELKSRGKAKAIGVSNFDEGHVRELIDAGYKPVVNQVQWHLGYHNDTFLEVMGKLGLKVMAWAPLAGPSKSQPGISLSDPRLKAVAARYKASTAQVALQWSMKKGVTPVTASCKKDHVIGNLAAGSLDLSKEDMMYLDSLKDNSTAIALV